MSLLLLLKPSSGDIPTPRVRFPKGRDEFVYYGLVMRGSGRRRSYPP